MRSVVLRDFRDADAEAVNRLSLTAFEEFSGKYSDPASRGSGIGRALTEECIERARRDRSPVIALHTSQIMTIALPMYLWMGFEWHHEAPSIFGVSYAVYLKKLPT